MCSDLGLTDQSMVFVERGTPLEKDQVALEVYLYDPNAKPRVTLIISDFPVAEGQRYWGLPHTKWELLQQLPAPLLLTLSPPPALAR